MTRIIELARNGCQSGRERAARPAVSGLGPVKVERNSLERSSRKTLDTDPEDRPGGPAQRGQVDSLQSGSAAIARRSPTPAGLDPRPKLRAGLVARGRASRSSTRVACWPGQTTRCSGRRGAGRAGHRRGGSSCCCSSMAERDCLPDDEAIAARPASRWQASRAWSSTRCEGSAGDAVAEDFERLGFDQVVSISAEHGLGVGDLLDAALAGLPRVELPEDEPRPVRAGSRGPPQRGEVLAAQPAGRLRAGGGVGGAWDDA